MNTDLHTHDIPHHILDAVGPSVQCMHNFCNACTWYIFKQRRAKEASKKFSVCSWRLKSENVLDSPTCHSWDTRTLTCWHARSIKQTLEYRKIKKTLALFTLSSPGVGVRFPAVIFSRACCCVSSLNCSDQDSSLFQSVFVPVFWGSSPFCGSFSPSAD